MQGIKFPTTQEERERASEGTFYANGYSAEVSLAPKLSSKVRVQRWPGPRGPVVGPPVIISDLNSIANGLAKSGFMIPWIVEKIKQHLLSGGVLLNTGQGSGDWEDSLVANGHQVAMVVRSEYRMATESEVLDYVDSAEYSSVTGHSISKRAQEKAYTLHYHEGPKMIQSYDSLPRQAKVILDLLNETERENFTEASIQMILEADKDRLKTKQEPMIIFGFYRKRLVDEGHLEEAQ